MNKSISIILFLFVLLVKNGACQSGLQGSLVIVGGGLEPDNRSIFSQLIELSGGADKAVFSVIPSASGVATQAFVYFRSELISYGVKPENIHLIPIAMADDDSTKDVDESIWRENGNQKALAEMVRRSSCVWFSGGDQLRTSQTLYNADGTQTLVLQAVWDVFKSGGVIGGTSAGAAIMSDPMIAAGSSMGALRRGLFREFKGDDFGDSQGVLISRGLGFFPLGMVDQHFNTRARLARLVLTIMEGGLSAKPGFGIDENTALIYIGQQNILKVAGAAGVTVVNASKARLSHVKQMPKIESVLISYMQEGDVYDVASGKIVPSGGKTNIKGKEYDSIASPLQAGMFSGGISNFLSMITDDLMCNKAADKVSNLNFIENSLGFKVTLSKTPESAAYFVRRPVEKFTIMNVRMDIVPVAIKTTPLK